LVADVQGPDRLGADRDLEIYDCHAIASLLAVQTMLTSPFS
jgi:hypothetical protein